MTLMIACCVAIETKSSDSTLEACRLTKQVFFPCPLRAMPRPLSYEQHWLNYGRRGLSAGEVFFGGDDEADEASSALSYERDELSSYLAGRRVAPVNYVHEQAEQPVHRVSKRAAQRQLAKHVAVKANLVAFARGHLTTVADALLPFTTQSAPNSAAPSPRPAATCSPPSAGQRQSRLAPWGSSDDDADEGTSFAANSVRSHPATCTCLACVERSIRRSVAANDLGNYGDFLAANSERLHRAMAQQGGRGPPSVRSAADSHHAFPPATWHYLQAPSDDASGYYQVSVSNGRSSATPTTVGDNGKGHTPGRHQDEADEDGELESDEECVDEDEEHLPRYVLQRYSQLSNLRGKTLSRAVRALAAEFARPVHARAASKAGGPVALAAVADPRVALAVTVAEMGERLPGGKRRPLSARLAEGLRDVLDGARQQRVGRAADPDDDSDEQEEGARAAARRRAHAAVLQEVRSASAVGAGVQGVGSSKGIGRAHEAAGAGAGSALATRMSTGGAAVPKPGAAKVGLSSMGRAKAVNAGGKEEGYAARAALSDSSEDEFSRRVTDAGAGMAQQRQRVTEAMSHTLRSLGGAPPVRVPVVVVEDSDEDQDQREHVTARASSRSKALRLSRSAATTPRSPGRQANRSTGGSAVGTGSSGWFLTRELKGGSDGSSEEDVRRAAGGRDAAPRGQQEALADAWEQRARRALSLGGVLVRPASASPRMQKTAGVAGAAAAAQTPLQQQQMRSMAGGKGSRGGAARQLTFAGDASSSSAASTAVYGSDVTSAADAARLRSEVAAARTRALSLGPEALSYDEVRLLSGAGAVHPTPGSPGAAARAAMRATWAPVSEEDYARMALALGHMGSLTSRISAPPDRPPSARGGQGTGGGRGVGAASPQGDGGKGQWAQRAFGHVSGGGAD